MMMTKENDCDRCQNAADTSFSSGGMMMVRALVLMFFCKIVVFSGSVARADSFDLESWKSSPRGQWVDQGVWNSENPAPWLKFIEESNPDCANRWYVTVGPLGLTSYFHDRDDYRTYPAFRAKAPVGLSDEYGSLFNSIEIRNLHSQSPSSGLLQPGDLLLSMDGHYFEAGALSFRNDRFLRTTRRQFQPHVGQLLDTAEGNGTVRLGVLRFPENYVPTPQSGVRSWSIKQDLINTPATLDLPLGDVGCFQITKTSGSYDLTEGADFLKLVNSQGDWIDLAINEGEPIGQQVEVPEGGDWRLVGQLTSKSAAQFSVSGLTRSALPANLQQYYQEIDVPLDQIGSFGAEYHPEGEKARNYRAILAHRIAMQQKPDGSWDLNGSNLPAFAASACGYALLSTGDPQYTEHVRKAAAYVANPPSLENWSYTNGFQLAFLSDYYLQTGDASVVLGIKRQVKNIRRYIQADYTAGHKESPGYGGTGWVGAGSQIALGLAVAAEAGLADADDLNLLDQMLARIRELGRSGAMIYKRGKSTTTNKVHGGGCSSGPYFIASLLRGGNASFTRLAQKRYSQGPYGNEDDGHATQTLHFIFSNLAIANASDESHIKNMSQLAWRYTLCRDPFGFLGKNKYEIEHHSGDGAVGYPIWRTAGALLVHNAHRKNLALTGKADYRSPAKETADLIHEERELYNLMLRSWSLAEAVMGSDAPVSFAAALAQLRAFTPRRQWDSDLRSWLTTNAPIVGFDILALPNDPAGGSRGQLVELIHLFGIESAFDEKNGENHLLLNPCPLAVTSGFEARDRLLSQGHFKMKDLTLTLRDPVGDVLTTPVSYSVSGAVGDEHEMRETFPSTIIIPNRKKFEVDVSYSIGSLVVNYTVPIIYPVADNREPNPIINIFQVDAGVLDDFSGNGYAGRLVMDTGRTFGFELWKEGFHGCMLRGATYRITLAMGDIWAYQLKGWQEITRSARDVPIQSITGPDGLDMSFLADRDTGTGIYCSKNSQFTITLDQPQEITSLYVSGLEVHHKVEALVGGSWVLVRNMSVTNLRPIAPTTSDQFRITINQNGYWSGVAFIRPEGNEYMPRSTWFKEASEYDGHSAPTNSPPTANDTTIDLEYTSIAKVVIGSVDAWDSDPGDSLLYSLTGGNAGGMFEIDAFTGEITLLEKLDIYTPETYSLTYSVRDFGFLTSTGSITIQVLNLPVRNDHLVKDGSLYLANQWKVQLPDADTIGYVSMDALIDSSITNFDLAIIAGNVTRRQNNIYQWRGDTDIVIAGGTLDYSASSPSGSTQRVLRMYDTSSLTMIKGAFKLWGGKSIEMQGESQIIIRGGSFSAGGLNLNGADSSLVFETGNGIVLLNSISIQPEKYINFLTSSAGTLEVSNKDLAYYQSLWDAGQIRHDGKNEGAFLDSFLVEGRKLSLIVNEDTDNDGLSDDWEIAYFGNLTTTDGTGDADADNDGLLDSEEFDYGTDPTRRDTDGDGFSDLLEITQSTNPNSALSKPGALYDGLFAWWKLDQSGATKALDSSGNGRDGVISGSPTWGAGSSGAALHLDGVNDKVTFTIPEPTTFPAYTVALWVKSNQLATTNYASVFNNNSSGSDFQLDTNGGNPGNYQYRGSSTQTMGKVTTGWQHLAVSFDGSTTQLYLNGKQVRSFSGVTGNVFGQLQLGVNRNGQLFFAGMVDEMMVWDRSLNAVDISVLAGVATNPGAMTYDEYVFIYSLSGEEAAPLADPDGDGMSNLEEWAMGGSDPTKSTDGFPPHTQIKTVGDDQYFEISWLHRTGGTWTGTDYQVGNLTYSPEGASDLSSWNAPLNAASPAWDLPAAPDGFEWASTLLADPAAFTKKGFLRIKLTHQP